MHIDIDIIRSWDYEKVYKWLIALQKIAEKNKEEIDKMQNETEMSNAVNSGEKVVIRSSQY